MTQTPDHISIFDMYPDNVCCKLKKANKALSLSETLTYIHTVHTFECQWSTCVPAVPTDCIVEGEVLKLGGPFLQTWQKKHLKLYPNRLEFYHKTRDGQVVKGKGVEVGPDP